MKKRSLKVLVCLLGMSMLCGCGNDSKKTDDAAETSEESSSADSETKTKSGAISATDFDVDKYVKIGDLDGLEVTVPAYTFSDEDVEKQMQNELEYYVQSTGAYAYTPILDRDTVEVGDTVDIDYVGTKDGVAFDGGTAEGYHLQIGSGQFIEGFEEGLVGHKVGEKVSLNLTFPEEYHSEELAGAAVVFDVTINNLVEQSMPELTDDVVKNMGQEGLETVDQFRTEIRQYLQDECDNRNSSEKTTAVWNAVVAKCEVSDPPQELVDDVLLRISENLTRYAQQYGVTEDVLITQYMGTTQEQYDADSLQSAQDAAKEKLIAAAIAKQAGLSLTDEELNEAAAKDAESFGYDSAEAVLNDIGKGAYYDYALGQKIDEYLLTKVKVVEQEPVSILGTMQDDSQGETLEEEVEESVE
ncbi:MAG: trigger factor [Lachnospiraceae bacterium]|nr:trigger factor [Lachnospiraceae bacterium]